jgi:hypothetical protein
MDFNLTPRNTKIFRHGFTLIDTVLFGGFGLVGVLGTHYPQNEYLR